MNHHFKKGDMKQEQIIHIGMINSFNVITGRNTYDEIINSDVNVFAHAPDEEPPFELIKLMIEYFSSFEMFEKCIELTLYLEDNFNQDGSSREEKCECILPVIQGYSKKMYCKNCNKRLKR
jgi:hypothetical protein